MRYRITVRRDAPHRIELRGYVDGNQALNALCAGLAETMGTDALVIASPAPPDYNPFAEATG